MEQQSSHHGPGQVCYPHLEVHTRCETRNAHRCSHCDHPPFAVNPMSPTRHKGKHRGHVEVWGCVEVDQLIEKFHKSFQQHACHKQTFANPTMRVLPIERTRLRNKRSCAFTCVRYIRCLRGVASPASSSRCSKNSSRIELDRMKFARAYTIYNISN